MSIENKPHPWISKLLLTTIRSYLKYRMKLKVGRNDTLRMKPPYIVLGNHVNNWDPLIINAFVEEPICFIAAEALFHSTLLSRLLNYVGVIPKTKFQSDTRTIRGVLKAKKHGRIIGLFPEGNRNWDGTTEPLTYATAKLVKSLNIPVVIAKIRGGHLSHPRWAKHYRRGEIEVSLTKLSDTDDFKEMSYDMIYKKLEESLYHNEMDFQEKKQITYKGKALAEYLERYLFICPQCGESMTMYSHQDIFQCRDCHYTVRYTEKGIFEKVNGKKNYFLTPSMWNQWQLEQLEAQGLTEEGRQAFTSKLKDEVHIYTSSMYSPLKKIGEGQLTWCDNVWRVTNDNGDQHIYEIGKLKGLNIHITNYLDFFYEDQFIRMVFIKPSSSTYCWLKFVELVCERTRNKEQEAI